MKSKASFYTQKQEKILSVLGENIRLARLRRKLSARSLAERAGIAVSTLTFIESGAPSVALGKYLQVLSILKLEDDLLLVAANDLVGRQLQDISLMTKKRAPKKKKSPSVMDSLIYKGNTDLPEFK
jgi:transcriptional regulator with XRE-family HTH domain